MFPSVVNTFPKVHLVGAGPGDVDLLTLKAARVLSQAEVVLVDDLVGAEVLQLCPQARVIAVGKRGGCASTPQAFIEKLLVHEALQGHRVVRLKGGDVNVFGRAGEEIRALQAAGLDYEIVPGVTAGIAAAASIQASLTHRNHAHGVAFLTAHGAEGGEVPWAALAAVPITLVIYMAVSRLKALQADLLAGGMSPDTPAIAIENVSRANERVLVSTVARMLTHFGEQQLASPAVLVIGEALQEAAQRWARQAVARGSRLPLAQAV